MPYCPKCGNQTEENMTFCPRCGASLKLEAPRPTPPPPLTYRKDEKDEKGEKQEKNEKGEKHEKGEFGFVGWLIGGIVIIAIGLLAYLRAVNFIRSDFEGPLIFLVIGVAIIIVAIYLSTTARRRHPAPPPPV